ncbi:hypothetical protein F2Q69_00012937 [Brassica cretica]|uniref:Uncharacterized protein n=1 Tax=Brassica cretica TaxID=69181 RepID=A0A8S9R1G3_BRACR|nr:hypothetical protein F2Q69_00012937 [Brassica cretica]
MFVTFGISYLLVTCTLWQLTTFGTRDLWQLVPFGDIPNRSDQPPSHGAIQTVRLTDPCLVREAGWDLGTDRAAVRSYGPSVRSDGATAHHIPSEARLVLHVLLLVLVSHLDRRHDLLANGHHRPRVVPSRPLASHRPFLIGFGVCHKPNPLPKPSGLSPRPRPKTQQPMASWPDLTARNMNSLSS